MATKTYEEYEKEQLDKAKAQAAEYEQTRKQQAADAAAQSDAIYEDAKKRATTQYTQSARDTESSYRSVYDANAVSELIARREAAEAIANTNMANSGLNNTQQTAISLQRSRADAKTTEAKQAAVNSIMRELDSIRAQYDSEAAAQRTAIHQQADTDVRENLATLTAAARQNASTMYNADVEAANAQADREFELQKIALEQAYENGDTGATTTDNTSLIGTSVDAAGTKGGYGSLTVKPYQASNGQIYTGLEAGKMRVYDFAFKLWNANAWGDISTSDGLAKAIAALDQYLQAQIINGNLASVEVAEEVRDRVINAVEYGYTW